MAVWSSSPTANGSRCARSVEGQRARALPHTGRVTILTGVAAALQPVYLLGGSDRPKVTRALARLRARIGEDAVELLSAGRLSGEDATAACNAFGLFASGQRLVVVTEAERWKAPDVKAVAAYLGDPSPGTILALVVQEVKRDSPLAKACASAGEVLMYDVRKRQLPGWVAGEFKRLGGSVDSDACRTLVELVGEDVDGLSSEIGKLIAWAAGQQISERDVQELVAPVAETPGYALTDAWGRRDVAGVLEASELLLERSASARRDELPRLAGVIGSHVARVRDCQLYDAAGLRPRDAAARMKRSPYYVEKLFGQARNFSTDELRDAVVRLAAVDLALKGGSRLAGDLELQRALVDITARADEAAPEPAVA